MTHDPMNDGTTLDGASPAKPPRRRGRALLWCFALAGAAGCAVQGLLLYQGHEREMALRVALRSATNEREQVANALRQSEAERASAESSLNSTRGTLRSVITERDGLRSTLRQTELARDNATRWLSAARDEVAECNEALEQAASIVRSHRDKLDEIASAIRIGMIGVADIPDEGFVLSGGYDLESEYRKVVKKYNDLVDRFNAAVERSNDLGDIVNRVINILRS